MSSANTGASLSKLFQTFSVFLKLLCPTTSADVLGLYFNGKLEVLKGTTFFFSPYLKSAFRYPPKLGYIPLLLSSQQFSFCSNFWLNYLSLPRITKGAFIMEVYLQHLLFGF